MKPADRAVVAVARVDGRHRLDVEQRHREAVDQAVDDLLELLDHPLETLRSGDRVFIKPNMFQCAPGFCSSRDVVGAVARRASDQGAQVTVGERTRNIYQLLQGCDVHRYAQVVSLDDVDVRVTHIESATSLRVPIAVPQIVLDCDYFIGIPQLRTHASVLMTNAMKNRVGLLPGFTTRIVHMAGVDESVVDLNVMRPQDLVVSDATMVIEGNYPMAGQAREVGLLAASKNAVAVDVVMAHVAGFDAGDIEYLRHARRRGLGPGALDEIEVRGLPVVEAAFAIVKAPVQLRSPRPGVHLYVESACEACQRYIAGALELLGPELMAFEGEMTILAGPMRDLPPLRGAVVLVGNCMYERRDTGVYIEGCPPRAIQVAAFRWAMGQEVTPQQRTQFRLPIETYESETV